jgi:hypothetical protein
MAAIILEFQSTVNPVKSEALYLPGAAEVRGLFCENFAKLTATGARAGRPNRSTAAASRTVHRALRAR